MLFGFLDPKTLLLIVHVFGAILGAGGAFASDSMFFSTMRDGRISKDELRFLKLGSRLVWSGLILLALSGAFLVAADPQRYLASSKFLVKLSIVGIIAANGIIFHLIHIPRLERSVEKRLASSPEFVRGSHWLMASGAISMVSWTSTVVLGMIRHIPYSYGTIALVYAVLVLLAAAGAVLLRKRLLHL